MLKSIRIAMLALASALPLAAQAAPIPYAGIGSEAPLASFVAAATGNITAYFFGTSADYHSRIGMKVNGVSTGIFGLPNHGSAYGDSLVLGSVVAGDVLELILQVSTTGATWSSNPVNNADGLNHVYSSGFAGDAIIPAGFYIGFEDLPQLGDRDYNDHQFVIVNHGQPQPFDVTEVPEPENLALLGLALVVLGVSRRRPR